MGLAHVGRCISTKVEKELEEREEHDKSGLAEGMELPGEDTNY